MGKPGFTMCLLVLLGLMATQANAKVLSKRTSRDRDDHRISNIEQTPPPISGGIENLPLAPADCKETTTANAKVQSTRHSWDRDDHLITIIEQTPPPISEGIENLALAPADWKETTTAHVISLDIPGIKKDAIKIEVEENKELRISGERKGEDEAEGDKWHSTERTNRKFWRQFRLPGNADLDHVKAHLGYGVLRITVPKFAEEKRRQPKVINIAGEEGFCGEGIYASKA